MIYGNYKPEDLTERKESVLIGLLKELAVLFPEKWSWNREGFWLHHSRLILETYSNTDETLLDYSTEDCDAVLAEHGMCMWVIPHGTRLWRGYFDTNTTDALYLGTIEADTKRLATEATFVNAIEYIIKQKKSRI